MIQNSLCESIKPAPVILHDGDAPQAANNSAFVQEIGDVLLKDGGDGGGGGDDDGGGDDGAHLSAFPGQTPQSDAELAYMAPRGSSATSSASCKKL